MEQEQTMTDWNMGAYYMMDLRKLLFEADLAGIRNDIMLKYQILQTVEEEISPFIKDSTKIEEIKEKIGKELDIMKEVESNILSKEEKEACLNTIKNFLHDYGKELRQRMFKSGILVQQNDDPNFALGSKK